MFQKFFNVCTYAFGTACKGWRSKGKDFTMSHYDEEEDEWSDLARSMTTLQVAEEKNANT